MISLPVILAGAIALVVLILAGMLLRRAARRRRGPYAPLTEAEARAHALPLTTSILSVTRQVRDRDRLRLDA